MVTKLPQATPGEWIADTVSMDVTSSNGKQICVMSGCSKEDEANCLMVAASKDMREALSRVINEAFEKLSPGLQACVHTAFYKTRGLNL